MVIQVARRVRDADFGAGTGVGSSDVDMHNLVKFLFVLISVSIFNNSAVGNVTFFLLSVILFI